MKLMKYILTMAMAVAAVAAPLAVYASSASPMEQVATEAPQVKVQPGAITIEIPGSESRHVAIYAITGQVVKQFNAAPGKNVVEMPAGYYIVRVDHLSVKVVVK